ncbi:MAG: YqjF family protein [Acidimicrobiales bacterium]
MDDPGFVEAVTADPAPWAYRSVLRQQWQELAYFHWAYDPAIVQSVLPAGVTVDTFDGQAWVGLIPFEMRRVQLGASPPVPWLGSFVEINVRTYVTDALGRRSVWFFSLDVPRAPIVGVARSVFSLPYCWAAARHEVTGDRHRYRMTRRWPRADGPAPSADMSFTVGPALSDDDVTALDHFLTARWALLTGRRRRLLYGRVHHARWPLHAIDHVAIHQDVIQAAGLPAPVGPPLARYSPGVDVQVAWFEALA